MCGSQTSLASDVDGNIVTEDNTLAIMSVAVAPLGAKGTQLPVTEAPFDGAGGRRV